MKRTAISILTSVCILATPIGVLANDNLQLSTYEKGIDHNDIKIIQRALKSDGSYNHNELTSYFGPITESAVKDFQRKYGLSADGVVGGGTIKKMESLGLFTYGVLTKSKYEKGMSHSEVQVIQRALKSVGVYNYGEYTDYFGPVTENAVKDFQRKYGLGADGIAGLSTLSKLRELGLVTYNATASVQTKAVGVLTMTAYKKGMNDSEVKILQNALKLAGTFKEDSTTSYFGPSTEQAVKDFQRKHNLTADGIAGGSTLEKLKTVGLVTYNVSRSSAKRGYGENLDWWSQVEKILVRNKTTMTVQDFETGLQFKVKYTAGSNHADVETLTHNDTNIMKKIWGGFSWERRPVLVFLNGRTIAASMTAMPHAGVEGKTAGQTVSGRSGGYGTGYNYDFVKGNGMSGHVDIHFKNSLRHKDNRQDSKHQSAIKKAAGLR